MPRINLEPEKQHISTHNYNYHESQEQPTFESNISALMSLKQQLLIMYHKYSPNIEPNTHHLKQLSLLKQQVTDSKQRIIKFKSMVDNMEEGTNDKIQEVKKEKDQLLEINEKIVAESEEMAMRLREIEKQKGEMALRYEEMLKERQIQKKKQKKQLDNLKLMHAQQLYMLKKKIGSNNKISKE